MNMNGPVAISRRERLQICVEIAARLHEVFGEKIAAIGVYGSVSRGTDGPFSDIEMFCVLKESSEPVDYSYEWSTGPWKAEVNVLSADVLLKNASTVEGQWPLTHGPFFSPLSLYDPDGFFRPSEKRLNRRPGKTSKMQSMKSSLVKCANSLESLEMQVETGRIRICPIWPCNLPNPGPC